MIFSIDPGLRMCGVAVWGARGEMLEALLLRPRPIEVAYDAVAWQLMGNVVGSWMDRWVSVLEREVVIELPQVYGRRALGKGDPNDLIQLAAVVGALTIALHSSVRVVRPAEWKGQVPKSVTEARCRKALAAQELERVVLPTKSLQHNVWDAVGLGLWYLKRENIRG